MALRALLPMDLARLLLRLPSPGSGVALLRGEGRVVTSPLRRALAAAASPAKDGKRAGAASGSGAAKAAKEELRQDDSKYRAMLAVLYPKDARPGKLPLPEKEELERRAVLAKLWSRYAVRRAHVQGKEIHEFIRARKEARLALQAAYPEALAAADARNAADSEVPFPVERRMPTNTAPLPATARR